MCQGLTTVAVITTAEEGVKEACENTLVGRHDSPENVI